MWWIASLLHNILAFFLRVLACLQGWHLLFIPTCPWEGCEPFLHKRLHQCGECTPTLFWTFLFPVFRRGDKLFSLNLLFQWHCFTTCDFPEDCMQFKYFEISFKIVERINLICTILSRVESRFLLVISKFGWRLFLQQHWGVLKWIALMLFCSG